MLFSMIPAPNTPEWLLIPIAVVFLVLLIGLQVWGMILEIRYKSPYTLIATSNRDKWRRAATIATLQTVMLPIIGLIAPVVSPRSDQWLFIPVCSGIWIIVLPIMTLFKRWDFERQVKHYRRLDRIIKDKRSIYQRLFSNPLIGWTRILMTAEHNRFFSDGYPDDVNQKIIDGS